MVVRRRRCGRRVVDPAGARASVSVVMAASVVLARVKVLRGLVVHAGVLVSTGVIVGWTVVRVAGVT